MRFDPSSFILLPSSFRKVYRDLWSHKGRTLLVVLSIAVGVLALGMTASGNALLRRQMSDAQRASRPSHVILYLGGGRAVDDADLHGLARLPEVAGVQGVVKADIRWKTRLDGEWQEETATLIALDDYEEQQFDLISLRSGDWPTSRSVAVEFNHVSAYGLPGIGGTVYFEVNNRARPMTVGGTVRDPQQFPPPFSSAPAFYVTRDTMELLAGYRAFSELRLTMPDFSRERAEAAADLAEDKLARSGVAVGYVQIQEPDRHPVQDMVEGVGLVLTVMAVVSLGLSTILVVNTVNSVIAQQVPQIGIMKTVGGLTPQIASIYLAGVAAYGLLSLLLAVPLGALGANLLSGWMLGMLNVPASPFEVLGPTLLIQLGTGLLAPLLAALWPILQGAGISVREALSVYGLGTGRYGARWLDRLLGRLRGMPRLASLALRNTFRRPGRVVLTQITLVATGAVFMMVVNTQYSFVTTISEVWRSFGFDVILGFDGFQRIGEIVPMLEAHPDVERAEMWVWANSTARPAGAEGASQTQQVFLRGIPRDTRMFTPHLVAGRDLDPRDGHALLLNQELARDMGLTVGDRLVVSLGPAGESTWTIVGLVVDITGMQRTAYVDRETLNAELNRAGRATVAEIQTRGEAPEAQKRLEASLRDFFKSKGIGVAFSGSAADERQMAEAQFNILTTILMVMTVLMAAVGSLGLSGTLSINVLERRREIGVMRAVGASSGDVGSVFMGEGLLLGLVSWAQAVPISLLAGRPFVEAIGRAIQFPAVYYFSPTGIWLWLIVVVVLSLLASGLPARRATRISVRESLAYE